MSIVALPTNVAAQIASSSRVTSLNDVVVELVKNALDAEARRVEVALSYGRGDCVVEDDGHGMAPTEFSEQGGLGKPHYTSKISQERLYHGSQGCFLASLSSLAVVTIVSQHRGNCTHSKITMHRSKTVTRSLDVINGHELMSCGHGTKVVVRDLFGNMPVRVKQRSMEAEPATSWQRLWKKLRRELVLLLLAWPAEVLLRVSFQEMSERLVIRADESSGLSTPGRVTSILRQAAYLPREKSSSWIPVSAESASVAVEGFISLEPSRTKHVQFITFGLQGPSMADDTGVFYDHINDLFTASAFGAEDTQNMHVLGRLESADTLTKHQSTGMAKINGASKRLDRWPQYHLHLVLRDIETKFRVTRQLLSRDLEAIVAVLNALIIEFLRKHNFMPGKFMRVPSSKTPIRHASSSGMLENAGYLPEQPVIPFSKHAKVSGSVPPRLGQGTQRSDASLEATKISKDCLESVHNDGLPGIVNKDAIPNGAGHEASSTLKTDKPLLRPLNGMARSRPCSAPPLINVTKKASSPSIVDRMLSASVAAIKGPTHLQESHLIEDDDDVHWINPVTGTHCLVNQRTGMVRMTRDTSQTSKSKRLTRPLHQGIQAQLQRTEWIESLLATWQNPVFKPSELAIPRLGQTTDDRLDHRGLVESGRLHECKNPGQYIGGHTHGRVSKMALQDAIIIGQVDRKFILVVTRGEGSNAQLVLIDQHAADERLRIEILLQSLCEPSVNDPDCCESSILQKPMAFEITHEEARLLKKHSAYFHRWGFTYEFSKHGGSKTTTPETTQSMTVSSLPTLVAARLQSDPRHLLDLLRSEARAREDDDTPRHVPPPFIPGPQDPSAHWVRMLDTSPQGLVALLNSRACRSAIMFNDALTKEECTLLVRRLARCSFPFICAHGRPSLVALVDVHAVGGQGMPRGEGIGSGKQTGSVGRLQDWEGCHEPMRGLGAWMARARGWRGGV